MDLTLYFFPGACSRVTMTALEAIGVPYRDCCVNLRVDAHRSATYRTVNPKAKVPALDIGGRVMTENAAILFYLDRSYPAANLLPRDEDAVGGVSGLVDLAWCASTLQPMMRQIRAPDKYTAGDPAPVKADGMGKFAAECDGIATRLADRWWYGDRWSIVDTYLFWLLNTAQKGGFPLADYPALVRHAQEERQRPALQRALARERVAAERHAIDGLEF